MTLRQGGETGVRILEIEQFIVGSPLNILACFGLRGLRQSFPFVFDKHHVGTGLQKLCCGGHEWMPARLIRVANRHTVGCIMSRPTSTHKDSQLVELVGRSWLISQLLQAGLEVARPERDRGIDLIAYLDLDKTVGDFIACPIQVKAASKTTFSVNPKYERFPRMLIAYVWEVDDSSKTVAYALTYGEALAIARKKKWTRTLSWVEGGKNGKRGYSVTAVREHSKLWCMLQPFQMIPELWLAKVKKVCGCPMNER